MPVGVIVDEGFAGAQIDRQYAPLGPGLTRVPQQLVDLPAPSGEWQSLDDPGSASGQPGQRQQQQ